MPKHMQELSDNEVVPATQSGPPKEAGMARSVPASKSGPASKSARVSASAGAKGSPKSKSRSTKDAPAADHGGPAGPTDEPTGAQGAAAESGPKPADASEKAVHDEPVHDKAVHDKAVHDKAVHDKAVRPAGSAKRAAPPREVFEPAADDEPIEEFLVQMRALLYEERSGYVRQADELKAEADSLALEHEPGDVQFDEEGGEGGTSNVDRELDLVLSAQARSAINEIDRALLKIDGGTYGTCEQCGRPIPQARLKALPYASLCVACKSGGLSRR